MTNPTFSYYAQCVGAFISEMTAARELEAHLATCEECRRIEPEVCGKAKQIIEQQNQPEEKVK